MVRSIGRPYDTCVDVSIPPVTLHRAVTTTWSAIFVHLLPFVTNNRATFLRSSDATFTSGFVALQRSTCSETPPFEDVRPWLAAHNVRSLGSCCASHVVITAPCWSVLVRDRPEISDDGVLSMNIHGQYCTTKGDGRSTSSRQTAANEDHSEGRSARH